VVNNDQPIIADVFNEEMIKQVKEQISKEPLQTKQENGKEVTFITFKLPKGTHLKKAAKYHPLVNTYAKRQRIPNALVFAIIHAESYFNPLARSHIPAFGLMQIVPNSAGVDAYEYLYGKKRLLNADYLYDGKRNITIGTAYIHLLYYRYLKGITNKYSRLYCTMAAYNTGPGNIARTFTNTRNIKQAVNVINRLTPQEVYEKLKNELPYEETRNYIVKVNRLMHQYAGFKPQGENN
jgi:membrane-bound lytic murein transglycosylase C